MPARTTSLYFAAASALAGFIFLSTTVADLAYPIPLAAFVLCTAFAMLAIMAAIRANISTLKIGARAGVALALGILSLFPVGMMFDQMNWPYFHSWALAHGTMVFVVPVASVIIYLFLGIGRWFGKGKGAV